MSVLGAGTGACLHTLPVRFSRRFPRRQWVFSSADGLDQWILVGSKMDKFFFYFCVAIVFVLSVLTIVSSNELVLDSHADDTLNDLVKRFHSWKVSIQA